MAPRPHPVDGLPTSAKAIRLALLSEEELTRSELLDVTRLPPRTTDEGLQHLVRVGLLEERPATQGDAREKVYTLDGDPALN